MQLGCKDNTFSPFHQTSFQNHFKQTLNAQNKAEPIKLDRLGFYDAHTSLVKDSTIYIFSTTNDQYVQKVPKTLPPDNLQKTLCIIAMTVAIL